MLRPGGARAIVAESLLLKQQLLVVSRNRQHAPNLESTDRFLLGFLALFLRPDRIARVAIVVRPSTLLRFHQALVRKKYREHRQKSPYSCRVRLPAGTDSGGSQCVVGCTNSPSLREFQNSPPTGHRTHLGAEPPFQDRPVPERPTSHHNSRRMFGRHLVNSRRISLLPHGGGVSFDRLPLRTFFSASMGRCRISFGLGVIYYG